MIRSKSNSTRTPTAQIHDPLSRLLWFLHLFNITANLFHTGSSRRRSRYCFFSLIHRRSQIVLGMLLHRPYNKIPSTDPNLIFQSLNSANAGGHKPSFSRRTHGWLNYVSWNSSPRLLRIYRQNYLSELYVWSGGFWDCEFWWQSKTREESI